MERDMIEPQCRVHLNWEHFRRNIEKMARKGKTLMPVIKADAYGHGVLQAAAELTALGIGWAAVGSLAEAELVRDSGYGGTLVSLLACAPSQEQLRTAREKRLVPLIHDWNGVESVLKAASDDSSLPLCIAIKADTGMGRLGFLPEELESVAEKLAAFPCIIPQVLISHLSVADEPEQDDYTKEQARRFKAAADILHRRFPAMRCSLGNTAGLLSHTDLAGDICRPGLAVYGYNPMYGTSRGSDGEGFLPVMGVSVPLISVHRLKKGESLGYGRTYVADSDRLVGWVPIGYADGYRRNPAPGTSMCVGGVRVPVIGRVAMQMTCLDLTDLPSPPSAGDEVWVMGGPGDAVTAQDLAGWWGTIPYEVICLLGKNRRD